MALVRYQMARGPGLNEHALFMNSLADSYYEAANFELVRDEYEKIARLTTGRLDYGDL